MHVGVHLNDMHPAEDGQAPAPQRDESVREAAGEYEIVARPEVRERWLAAANPYAAAMAFVRGEIEVKGDLIAAVKSQLARRRAGWGQALLNWICGFAPWRIAELWQTRSKTARGIRFHYDRSNDFYRQFLDSRLVYSCAYFRNSADGLDAAQLAKLDLICRKLRLKSGDRFLDIGCGWGALAMHAAGRIGARATGCTLSRRQAEYARAAVAAAGLAGNCAIHEMDYRDLEGSFDKIASVGMFEHVGKLRLTRYFRKVWDLLAADGLFMNSGVTRPNPIKSDASTFFIARRVFPGGRIVTLGEAIETAEEAGFEVLDIEGLRQHYALTCRAWVTRLRARRTECLETVDEQTWRIWQLYLAGSAVAFEEGSLGLHQMLLAKRGAAHAAPMTRDGA
jgi:cyclopropane-fatty-acyl-phospholipid synthase